MLVSTILWGTVVGLIHFVAVGMLYGNPIIDRFYREAAGTEPGVKVHPSKPKYFAQMFLGTQVEIYILAFGFLWIRPLLSIEGWVGTILLGLLFAGIRVYPRFWNMWIQSTYPNRLLAIEFVNGILSTLVVVSGMHLLT
jgi:hypothetical protein